VATSSEIKSGLDSISAAISSERQALKSSKARINLALTALTNIPTNTAFTDVIATINAFSPATTDPFEQLAIAELAKLTAEFQSLKPKAQTAVNGLATIDFTT